MSDTENTTPIESLRVTNGSDPRETASAGCSECSESASGVCTRHNAGYDDQVLSDWGLNPDGTTPSASADAAWVAQQFHEAYERLAPSFGYETRKASAVPWADVPEPNRSLMVAVAGEALAAIRAERHDGPLDVEVVNECLAELAESPLPGARYAFDVVKRRLGGTYALDR